MSKQRQRIQQQIIEAAKKTSTSAQQRVIEIGTLLSKLEDTTAREMEQKDRGNEDEYVQIAEFEAQSGELLDARKLLCDLWMTYPDVRGLINSRSGKTLCNGIEQETGYEGRDLSGTPEAEEFAEPAMILSKDEIREVFLANGFTVKEDQPDLKDYVFTAAEKLLEKAWYKGTPPFRWKVTGEEDPHGDRYDCERAQLAMGKWSDDELANGAFLNYDRPFDVNLVVSGRQIPPISWMTGVKDRIRWLSRHLETALSKARKPVDEPLLKLIDELVAGQRIGLIKPLNGKSLIIEFGNQDFREVMGVIPSKEIVVNRAEFIAAIGTEDIDGWVQTTTERKNHPYELRRRTSRYLLANEIKKG